MQLSTTALMLVAIAGALALLLRSRGLRRRKARIADTEMVRAAMARTAPPQPRAVVRAEQHRRVVERRERVQTERQRLREEAQRAAAEAWDARVRATRERNEAEARARAETIESARRFRAQRAADLLAQREAAEQRRLEYLRANEARRREEAAERARRRAAELAARRERGLETFAAMREDVIAEELQRQHETELSRAAVVQLRSEEARELARSWIITAQAAEARDVPPPLWGEHHAVERCLVEHDVVMLPAREDPSETSLAEAPDLPCAEPSPDEPARPREKVAVVALDVETLNARLAQLRDA